MTGESEPIFSLENSGSASLSPCISVDTAIRVDMGAYTERTRSVFCHALVEGAGFA